MVLVGVRLRKMNVPGLATPRAESVRLSVTRSIENNSFICLDLRLWLH